MHKLTTKVLGLSYSIIGTETSLPGVGNDRPRNVISSRQFEADVRPYFTLRELDHAVRNVGLEMTIDVEVFGCSGWTFPKSASQNAQSLQNRYSSGLFEQCHSSSHRFVICPKYTVGSNSQVTSRGHRCTATACRESKVALSLSLVLSLLGLAARLLSGVKYLHCPVIGQLALLFELLSDQAHGTLYPYSAARAGLDGSRVTPCCQI